MTHVLSVTKNCRVKISKQLDPLMQAVPGFIAVPLLIFDELCLAPQY